jgi:hypothetical protein
MIMSPSSIYCPSDFSRKEQTVGFLLYLRSDGQYILVSDTIMAVFLLDIIPCDVLRDSGRSFLLKVR